MQGLYYEESFVIAAPVGNNIFSYDQRKKIGSECQLVVPSLIDGTIDDVQCGDQIVFEEVDHHGNLVSCTGLKHLVSIQHGAQKIVVMDNHNHALFFWYEAWCRGTVPRGVKVIHVDQHSDMAVSASPLVLDPTQDQSAFVWEQVNFVLNIGNFIVPGQQSGLIGEVVQVRTQHALEDIEKNFDAVIADPYILDIDLDFWADALHHIDNDLRNRVVKKLMQHASLITVATSPYFIEQHKALEVLRKLLEE